MFYSDCSNNLGPDHFSRMGSWLGDCPNLDCCSHHRRMRGLESSWPCEKFGIGIPDWVVTCFWIVVVAFVVVFCIRLVASM